jgi:hypothetical protein
MFRWLTLSIAAVSLSACDLTSGSTFTAPSGAVANTAKCSQSSTGCFKKAAATCGGPYLVLDSESHSGGVLADAVAGPVTWYSMTYQCGPSDGKMPIFAFRGSPTVNVNVE